MADPVTKVSRLQYFSNRNLFVGIDVHKKRWQVAVLCEGMAPGNVSIDASVDLRGK